MQDGAICRQRFRSFSNAEHERKRARHQLRDLIDCTQNYTCTFHFAKNIRQSAVISILKLKIIRHNHENDEKL